jgi:hypothetical protein
MMDADVCSHAHALEPTAWATPKSWRHFRLSLFENPAAKLASLVSTSFQAAIGCDQSQAEPEPANGRYGVMVQGRRPVTLESAPEVWNLLS